MSGSTDWSVLMYLGVGLGVLFIGAGILVVCLRFAGLVTRATETLDEVDRHMALLTPPLARTLDHIGGIADTADVTLARFGAAVGSLEGLADGVAKTANAAQTAVTPAMLTFGATLATIAGRLSKIIRGRSPVEAGFEHHGDR